jgi:hypothetical protein
VPLRNKEWGASISTAERLNRLVWEGVLPEQEVRRWQPAAGEEFPTPETTQAVVFEWAFLWGLNLPTHPFVRGILYYFGLQLCNLNPNSIIHIAIFINLCEAYLGIAPHFDLFRYFFCLKSRPNDMTPKVVGGAGFQLKQKHSAEYIFVHLKSSNKGWHHE